MSIALWCVFSAALLHFLTKIPLIKAQASCTGGYDNNNPRQQQSSLTGWGQRALAAHQNQLESFGFFAAGVIVGTLGHAQTATLDILAVMYIIARITYWLCYMKDLATLRSLCWTVGFFSSLALLSSPSWSG